MEKDNCKFITVAILFLTLHLKDLFTNHVYFGKCTCFLLYTLHLVEYIKCKQKLHKIPHRQDHKTSILVRTLYSNGGKHVYTLLLEHNIHNVVNY